MAGGDGGELVADVDGITHGGEGVARVEGKAVFVAGALPGERVRLRIVDDRRRWARAELVEVLVANGDRVEPPCPYVPACGGCDLQHASPDAQRRLKTRVVREQLERLGGVSGARVEDCRAVGPDVGYRNHIQLHSDPADRLGYYRAGSHEVVPIERCLVATDAVGEQLGQIDSAGGAETVQVRAHPTTGAATVVAHPGPGPLELPDVDADVVIAQPGGGVAAIRGDGTLAEQVAGFTFRFGPRSFFQVTTAGAEAIVATVLEAAGDVAGHVAWDLYGGVGLLALPLARAGAAVTCVEQSRSSAGWAQANASAHDLEVTVVTGPVEAFVARAHADEPDLVVLDPPRVGAGEQVCKALVRHGAPRIIYVACDVAALARDVRTLVEGGYRLQRTLPLDLFPMTHHVEIVATLGR